MGHCYRQVVLRTAPPCYEDDGSICKWVYDVSGENAGLATAADWFIGNPVTILLTLLIAWVVNRIARRAITSGIPKIVSQRQIRIRQLEDLGVSMSDEADEADEADVSVEDPRTAARTAAITTVLRSVVSVTIWTIAILMMLGTVGVNIAPLLAGAGIAGLALGFGAQTLVQDCIAGFFMLTEDQFGIGDVVDTGYATGTVESVSLRTTVLRSLDGTVWHVPNGKMERVGNLSQRYSMAVVDVDVAYHTDLTRAREILHQAAAEVCESDDHSSKVLESPEVLGVERLGSDGITLRLTVMVRPGDQWGLQRALREHIKRVFDAAEIEIPFPQRTVWTRVEPDTPSRVDSVPTSEQVPPDPPHNGPAGPG